MRDLTRRNFLQIAGAAAAGATMLDVVNAEQRADVPPLQLQDGWALQSTALVEQQGDAISRAGYKAENWYATSLPSTVLNSLVKHHVYPDPRVGLNAYKIPDSSAEFNAKHDLDQYSHLPNKRNPWRDPWWYRTEFKLDPVPAGRRVWLHFDGINYRGEVWLNGKQITDQKTMAGMFQRFQFDITDYVRNDNALAVKIYPVDHPGTPDTQLEVLGQTRSQFKENARDVTENYTIGYDCMMTVPDRNMGIWQRVWIDSTGPVDLRNPFIVTDLPLPDTNRATIAISAELVNATAEPARGTLSGSVAGTDLHFEQPVELAPHETKTISVDPQLVMQNPRLWWPVNYGEQYLYEIDLQFTVGGSVSAERKVSFGVRKVTTEMHEVNGWYGRRVMINGQKILCRGGWVQPELLLDWDAARMDEEIRYYAESNVNLIYCCDVMSFPDEFLDACDRRGVMFGNCFYDDYPDFPKEANTFGEGVHFPDDMELLESCTADVIKRYRNHPSQAMYLCMVERTPPKDVYEMWRKQVVELDNTRFFIPSEYFPSVYLPSDYYSKDRIEAPPWIKPDLPTGMNDWVPKSYGWEEPVTYFQWVRASQNWMFMMESGTATVPPMSSLVKFMPNARAHNAGEKLFPLLPVWAHHGANSYYKPCDAALRRLFGESENVTEYCWKQLLITADQNRAMFEAVNHRMWTITSGFTQWKINSCEPSIQWQMFDWYHKPLVSWFFIKKAGEPLHVQLDLPDRVINVINTRLEEQPDLEVRARMLDLTGRVLWEKTDQISAPANAYAEAFAVPDSTDPSTVHLVKLELKNSRGHLISDNYYWFPAKESGFNAMNSMPLARLDSTYQIEPHGAERIARVKVSNPTSQPALFVQLALTRGPGGAEILPVIWEDNYFALLPGETRELTATVAASKLGNSQPTLEVGGWNVHSAYHCSAIKGPGTVQPGESFELTAHIASTFLDGSRVDLLVNGRPEQSKWAWARDGQAEEVRFNLSLPQPGRYRLQVGANETSITVS